MLSDANTADRAGLPDHIDVCVIGAGPAGITVARRLAATGITVALMEAGGLDISPESQDLYAGVLAGLDYYPLDVTRLRYLGGTSNHWGGYCRALETYDFAPKPYEPLSGWPIGRIDLDPYQAEADRILDLIPESQAPDLPIEQQHSNFRRFQFRFSSMSSQHNLTGTNFNEKYRAELEASQQIRLYLNANLVDLRLDDSLGLASSAVFRSYDLNDKGFEVRARYYALCAGGIENPRLLLNFTSQIPQGIGNQNNLVGRYFCEHPTFVLADALLAQPPDWTWETQCYSPTEQFMAEQQILDFGLRLEPATEHIPLSLKGAMLRGVVCQTDFTEHLAAQVLGRSPDCYLGGLLSYTAIHGGPDLSATVRIAAEQALNPDSRVRLGDGRDQFGLRTTILDWHLSDLDYRTMRTAIMTFGRHMAEVNLGRARVRDWVLDTPVVVPDLQHDEVGGNHHMCTTRMADDPRSGVVDANCRVHGIDNLYIGGSSVFATGGQCNPTYTITQLALRLGDHIITRLQAA